MTTSSDAFDHTEERLVSEALTLPERQRRRIALALLRSVKAWPDAHDPKFLEELDQAPAEVKQAALEAALALGVAELEDGKGVETTPEELLSDIDAELGMRRDDAG